jgi:hypothetical protein
MTKLVFLLLLSASAPTPVQAGDTRDSLRDVMDFCNQFVIKDPDPYLERGVRLGFHRDCFINDRDDPWR